MPSTKSFCGVCGYETPHKRGRCVECDKELRSEHIRWIRTKRKCLGILTVTGCLVLINWALAQEYSKDDMIRTALGSLASGIAVWFSTSKAKEDEV